jgi:hypothetical protein
MSRTANTSSERFSGPALRAYFSLTAAWRLDSENERCLPGRPPRSTFRRWKRTRSGRLSHDVLERISYVLGIYADLHTLFSDPVQADTWIRRANQAPLFAGGTALDRMLAGHVADLYVVRQYLASQFRGL